MISCRELIGFLDRYIAGELPPAEQAAFDHHLADCSDCVNYVDSYRQTIRLSKAAMNDSADIPRDIPEKVVQAILSAQRKV